MKKNKMMRLASVLLVAVLLTTCAISGTWAKYTSKGVSNDSARVAKWGVTVTGNSGAFQKEYTGSDSTLDVKSTEKVVAPGTSGTLAKFTIDGSPEVAIKLAYTADLELTGWTLSDTTTIYCPIVFNVNGTELKIAADETLDEFEARVEAAIVAIGTNSAPIEAAETMTISDVLEVSWSWAFNVNDTNDTYLGDQATLAGKASGIALDVTCIVNQYTN